MVSNILCVMLSALLPGVREVRTPLVVGALWAACAWLLVGYRIADDAETRDFIERLNLDGLPAAVWLSAGGLLIYLVGSLLVVRTNPLERPLTRLRHRVIPGVHRLDEDRLPRRLRHRLAWRTWRSRAIPDSAMRRLRQWCTDEPQGYSAVDQWLMQEYQTHRNAGRVPLMQGFETCIAPPNGFEAFYDAKTVDAHLATIEHSWEFEESLTQSFRWAVKQEQPAVEVRIQMRFPDVYAEIDRLKVEAELRMSIFWPLLILAVLLAVAWSPFALVAGLLPPWLLRDASRRANEASETTWGTVVAGEITTPILDAMKVASTEDCRDFGKRFSSDVPEEQAAAA